MARYTLSKNIDGITYYLRRLERIPENRTDAVAVYTKEPGAALTFKTLKEAKNKKDAVKVLKMAEVTEL